MCETCCIGCVEFRLGSTAGKGSVCAITTTQTMCETTDIDFEEFRLGGAGNGSKESDEDSNKESGEPHNEC